MGQEGEEIEGALEDLQRAERQVEQDEQRLVQDQEKVREAIREIEEAREHLLTITVDKVEHKVAAGTWEVAKLKAALGIDPARVLAEITPHGLTDLADDGKITLHQHERFMTHARSGGSS